MRRIVAAFFAMFFVAAAHAAIHPGEVAPDALGHTQNGHEVTVSSLRGNVVVISFWATWCGYCMKELPILAGIQAQASAHHLALQVVAVDHKEDHDVFRKSARLLQSRLPNLLVTWDREGAIGRPFGADKEIPVMVLLHRNGTVAYVHVGYGEDMLDTIVSEINRLLAEPQSATGGKGVRTSGT
jgi:Thiol-disulfide isomerase and thioredoxins